MIFIQPEATENGPKEVNSETTSSHLGSLCILKRSIPRLHNRPQQQARPEGQNVRILSNKIPPFGPLWMESSAFSEVMTWTSLKMVNFPFPFLPFLGDLFLNHSLPLTIDRRNLKFPGHFILFLNTWIAAPSSSLMWGTFTSEMLPRPHCCWDGFFSIFEDFEGLAQKGIKKKVIKI